MAKLFANGQWTYAHTELMLAWRGSISWTEVIIYIIIIGLIFFCDTQLESPTTKLYGWS